MHIKMSLLKMKKTYHRNRTSSSRRSAYIGGGIALLLVVVFFSFFSASMRDASTGISGIGKSVSRASASVFSSFFLGDSGARITALEEENADILLSLEKSEETNARYEAMLYRYGENVADEDVVLAGVLVTPPRSLYDTIVIDRGINAGIATGAYVYASHNRFIGTVVAVSKKTALVELVSSPGNIAEVVLGVDTLRAEAVGKGSGNLTVTLPRDIDVVEGETVFLPGFSGATLGTVDVIETEPNDPFQEIRIRMDVNLSALTDVAVLPPAVTEFPSYVPHVKDVLDVVSEDGQEFSDEGANDSESEMERDDSSATSSDEVVEETEE